MDPEDTPAAHELIKSLRPSPDALLGVIRRYIDDSMLEEIAQADYGHDASDHLKALRQIRDEGKILAPPKEWEWAPHEVLALIRWSEPDDPSRQPRSTGLRGHWMRAFACAALLRSAAEPENRGWFDGENQTVVQLVASCLSLGNDLSEAALRFLAWKFGTLPRIEPLDEEDRPFFALALLILTVHLSKPGDDPQRILDLVALLEEEEARIRRRQDEKDFHWKPEQWLLGLTNYNLRHDTWRALARKALLNPNRSLPIEVFARVQMIGKRLLGLDDQR